jgi:hypothetical protein
MNATSYREGASMGLEEGCKALILLVGPPGLEPGTNGL